MNIFATSQHPIESAEYKFDDSIDTLTAYKMYIASKPWVSNNYLRLPNRKPDWI